MTGFAQDVRPGDVVSFVYEGLVTPGRVTGTVEEKDRMLVLKDEIVLPVKEAWATKPTVCMYHGVSSARYVPVGIRGARVETRADSQTVDELVKEALASAWDQGAMAALKYAVLKSDGITLELDMPNPYDPQYVGRAAVNDSRALDPSLPPCAGDLVSYTWKGNRYTTVLTADTVEGSALMGEPDPDGYSPFIYNKTRHFYYSDIEDFKFVKRSGAL